MTGLLACRGVLGITPLPGQPALAIDPSDPGESASTSDADAHATDRAWAQWRVPNDIHHSKVETRDGINHDLVTGLDWQRTYEAPKSWEEANAACEALSIGGETNFHLPTRIELLSIMDFARADTGNPFPGEFLDPDWNCYWTVSGETDEQTHWLLAAQHARFVISHRNTTACVARCVRGVPYEYGREHNRPPAYEIRDGIIHDPKTELDWEAYTSERANDSISLEEAESYCHGLERAGSADWRLPSVKELETLVDERRIYPAADPRIATESKFYWSGTEHRPTEPSDGGIARLAWRVSFTDGTMIPGDDGSDLPAGRALARCVRSAR